MSDTTTTAPIGSGWDACSGPAGALPHHLAEWIQESAVAPELAAANVLSLRGSDVLEALAGDRLEALGGHSGQYATAPVARLLRPLEPLAEAGGWWAAGLDPLADWAPMAWGQFKSDRPRWDAERNRARKYEAPIGVPTRSAWLRVPAAVAQTVANRWGLPLPSAVSADFTGEGGAFWRWVDSEPRLPVVVTEGAKKAAALLTAGVPAVALPGVDNGAKRTGEKGSDGRRAGPVELLPDLAALSWARRRALVLFDWSENERGRRDVARAARRLGRQLRIAGAVVEVGTCPGPHKGADDALAAGVSWEQLEGALEPLTPEPVRPRLRPAMLRADAGQFLGDAAGDVLRGRRLIATNAPMGAGKTTWAAAVVAPFLSTGVPVLAPTHRTALGESQSAALGIPWAPAPGTDDRLQGAGLCWDSLRPSSGLGIRPGEWLGADGRGPVVLMDEIVGGVEHVLFGTGTAVAEHRPETMATAAQLLQSARLVVGMDAQLSEPVLRLLEALTGETACLIGSAHRPMAGRSVLVPQGLTARTAAEQGRARVLELAKARRRAFVVTSAQQAHAKGAASNLAALVRRHWPEARVLVIDSEHPEAAELLGNDPNGTAAAFDWIVCSPAITSGLSIDAPGLFAEVVVIGAGGRLSCEALAQAAARVRDPACPVRIYAPAIAPQLRIGSGDTNHAELLRQLARCEAHLLAQLVAAGSWEANATNESPWLRCWLELAAYRNAQAAAYAVSVAALLESEGWAVSSPSTLEPSPLTEEAGADLEEIATAATAAADAAVIAAPLPTPELAAELAKRRRLSPAERAQLQRYTIARRWGLGDTPPTPELLETDRQGLARLLRFRWLLQAPDRRELVTAHDHRRTAQLAPDGRGWAPDLVRELLGHRLTAAEALGLPRWLEQADEWFSAQDPRLLELHTLATTHAGNMRATLGVSPGKRASGTLRSLAGLMGCTLEAERRRCGGGERIWFYRLTPQALPCGADWGQLEACWREELNRGGGHFSPFT